MVARSELRKEAYFFILKVLSNLSESSDKSDWSLYVPMEELRLLKEGLEDPSPALVALVKEMLKGSISDSAVDAHLVMPFENLSPEKKKL